MYRIIDFEPVWILIPMSGQNQRSERKRLRGAHDAKAHQAGAP
jgi:hypothetical protein